MSHQIAIGWPRFYEMDLIYTVDFIIHEQGFLKRKGMAVSISTIHHNPTARACSSPPWLPGAAAPPGNTTAPWPTTAIMLPTGLNETILALRDAQ
jgi:hypothetical protein